MSMTTITMNPVINTKKNVRPEKKESFLRKIWNAVKESYIEYATMVYEPRYYAYSRRKADR